MTHSIKIIIGGDFDKNFDDLIHGRNLSKIHHNELYLDSFEQLHELLSPKKLDLLKYIIGIKKEKTVSRLAKETNRKQEAISRDLKQLKKLGLIETKKDKQKTYPSTKYTSIEIITK